MVQSKNFCCGVLSLILVAISSCSALACTVWGAAGEGYVDDGGVPVTKIRDERPGPQNWRRVEDGNGYAFEGLFAGKYQNFNMGVNEKGFVVARTTAGSVPEEKRFTYKSFRNAENGQPGPEFLIRNCASVDEALRHVEVFTGRPINYIMADTKEIAVVEVLPNGSHTVQRTSLGYLTHTNHYKQKESEPFNEKINKSSMTRLKRINELLETTPHPWSMEQFIVWTRDQNAGPTNSLFRTGTRPDGPRTLSDMTVHITHNGIVKMRIQYQQDPQNNSEWLVKDTSFKLIR